MSFSPDPPFPPSFCRRTSPVVFLPLSGIRHHGRLRYVFCPLSNVPSIFLQITSFSPATRAGSSQLFSLFGLTSINSEFPGVLPPNPLSSPLLSPVLWRTFEISLPFGTSTGYSSRPRAAKVVSSYGTLLGLRPGSGRVSLFFFPSSACESPPFYIFRAMFFSPPEPYQPQTRADVGFCSPLDRVRPVRESIWASGSLYTFNSFFLEK